jgi:hypothetical protein
MAARVQKVHHAKPINASAGAQVHNVVKDVDARIPSVPTGFQIILKS